MRSLKHACPRFCFAKPGAETTRQHYVFDAWNRMTAVKQDDGAGNPGSVVANYTYDGGNRRIQKSVWNGASYDLYDIYYNNAWQQLEVRKNATVNEQTVWSFRYIDAPVLRLRDTNNDGTLDEKLYFTNDAAMHVTSVVSVGGAVLERYSYDPYGRRSVWNAAMTATTAASAYAVNDGFTGRLMDNESGLWYFRNRYFDSSLGRFTQRDPMGYVDGFSLYGGYFVPDKVDPNGLRDMTLDITFAGNGIGGAGIGSEIRIEPPLASTLAGAPAGVSFIRYGGYDDDEPSALINDAAISTDLKRVKPKLCKNCVIKVLVCYGAMLPKYIQAWTTIFGVSAQAANCAIPGKGTLPGGSNRFTFPVGATSPAVAGSSATGPIIAAPPPAVQQNSGPPRKSTFTMPNADWKAHVAKSIKSGVDSILTGPKALRDIDCINQININHHGGDDGANNFYALIGPPEYGP